VVENAKLEYHRLEANDRAVAFTKLAERKARQLGRSEDFAGDIKVLAEIQAAANSLAGDIITKLGGIEHHGR